MELTQAALAEMAGLSLRRLQQINKDLPPEEQLFVKGEGGKCDAAMFLRRWVQYSVNKAVENNDKISLDQVRAQHELLKIQKTEIELSVRRGELVDAEEVRSLWDDVVTTVRNRLMHIPTTVAQRLVMLKDPAEIKTILDKEIRSGLEMIAKCRLPQVTAAAEEEAEE